MAFLLTVAKPFSDISDGFEDYGEDVSKPWCCFGLHSLKQLFCWREEVQLQSHWLGFIMSMLVSTCFLTEYKFQEGESVY